MNDLKIYRILTWCLVGIVIIITITLMWHSSSKINNLQSQVKQLEYRNDAMVFQYANDQREIDKLKFTITGQNQEIENLQIEKASDSLFIHTLESKVVYAEIEYQQALSFIGTAEYIMTNLGVEFYFVRRR